jgi:CRISPR type IV-associated protein Csf3
MEEAHVKPIRVSAYPLTPVIADENMALDGILLAFAMQERHGRRHATAPGQVSRNPVVALPVEKRGTKPQQYYACSFAEWDGMVRGKSFWTKRFRRREAECLVDFRGRRGRVIVESGRYKSYQMPIFYIHAARIDWYLFGELDAVRSLLTPCTHIGKKTAYGWGRVLWEIEEWHEDWSVVRDGGLMRAVPVEQLPDGIRSAPDLLYAGYYPPYWYGEHQAFCAMPCR